MRAGPVFSNWPGFQGRGSLLVIIWDIGNMLFWVEMTRGHPGFPGGFARLCGERGEFRLRAEIPVITLSGVAIFSRKIFYKILRYTKKIRIYPRAKVPALLTRIPSARPPLHRGCKLKYPRLLAKEDIPISFYFSRSDVPRNWPKHKSETKPSPTLVPKLV